MLYANVWILNVSRWSYKKLTKDEGTFNANDVDRFI